MSTHFRFDKISSTSCFHYKQHLSIFNRFNLPTLVVYAMNVLFLFSSFFSVALKLTPPLFASDLENVASDSSAVDTANLPKLNQIKQIKKITKFQKNKFFKTESNGRLKTKYNKYKFRTIWRNRNVSKFLLKRQVMFDGNININFLTIFYIYYFKHIVKNVF
jgi:hypothetical protein